MEIKGVWEQQTGKYANGVNYKVGKIIMGSAFYSGARAKNDPTKYGSSVDLPGMRSRILYFESLEEAKQRVENAVAKWFKWVQS
jgi:hypothetical protein